VQASVVQTMRPAPLLVALMCTILLAGCSASQGAGGQEASAPGNLAYQGASSGKHQSGFACDGDGTVSVGAQLGSGSVTVKVLDADGDTVYMREFSGAGQSADSRAVQGAAGEWTLSAERKADTLYGGGWSGQYGIDASC
jgi:hypothetical protein